MEPESREELDSFLRRAASIAALGAAVGAAVGATRAARRNGGDDRDEERQALEAQESEPEEADEPHEADEADEAENERQPEQEQVAQRQEPEDEEQDAARKEPDESQADGQPTSETGNIVGRALKQVAELTGREPEGVLGLRRVDDGWSVAVEIVELRRVPSSTDVLASYDVSVDGDGELREYRRTGRYVRGRGEGNGQ